MKGAATVIANLQSILAAEYNLNLQYRLDTSSLKFLGVPKIAHKTKKFADRTHAFYMIVQDRLLVLGATPSVDVGKVAEETTVTSLFEGALKAEQALMALCIEGIEIAVKARDEATAEKLRHIEERHEKHDAWLEQQLTLIKNLSEPMYLAEKL